MKMPQGWNVEASAATKVEAKIDMSADVVGKGLCPECRQPMQRAYVDGTPVWSCVRDRVALPVENGDKG